MNIAIILYYTNNCVAFSDKIFHINSVLSSKFTYCMKFDFFNNSKVTAVLAAPPDNFCVMKNVCTENLRLRKNYRVPNDINNASDLVFTVNVQYIYPIPQASAQPSVPLLLMKRRANVMLVCFYFRLCCFSYYQTIIKWIIVLKIYVTCNVFSSNVILIISA